MNKLTSEQSFEDLLAVNCEADLSDLNAPLLLSIVFKIIAFFYSKVG